MKVGRYDYAGQLAEDIDEILSQAREMLLAGRFVLTREVLAFEAELAAFLEVGHSRGVNSGTDALIVAMLALGIGPGDEVITQANTFNATVTAIRLVGATPVLVDAEEAGFTLDASALEAAISPRTRALMPVHLFGRPAPMEAVMALAQRHDLWVIEDAAQAIGARWRGIRVGGIGHLGCFSFHPSKNLAAAGDAGAVCARDPALDELVRQRKELGQLDQNVHEVPGLNSKIDSLQAIILSAKLRRLEDWNAERREIAAAYKARLADLPLRFQAEDPEEEHVWHLFQVRTDRRDALLAHLRAGGVDAVVRYPTPIHLQRAFRDQGWVAGQFPVAEQLADQLLCLPIRPGLQEAELDHVEATLRAFFGGGGG